MNCKNCGEPIKLCVGPISGCNDGTTYRHADGVMGLHACRNGRTKAEPVSETDLKPECEHLDYAYIENPDSPAIGDGYIGVKFAYCPKCGEKL